MKFYNREREIKEIEETIKLAHTKGAQFTVLTGRRRIGKSSLIQKVFASYKHFYFFVSKKKSHILLQEFGGILNNIQNDNRTYQNWEEFLEQLFQYSMTHKIAIIFDEFQEFYKIESSFFSIMQKLWDKYQNQKNLNIIVAGSVTTLLEKIFYSQKEPLYNRATQKINLGEFDFQTIYTILRDHKKKNIELEELLGFFGIFGGVPYYYQQIFKADLFSHKLIDIIDQLVFSQNAILKNEGREVLIQEFGREHNVYFAILEAIALNANTFSKILNYTKLEESVLARNLIKLENDFSLIKKEKPIFPNNQKVFRYKINNNFLNFWFRYVYPNQSLIESNFTKEIVKNINQDLRSLVGIVFEKYCLCYMLNSSYLANLHQFGSWWDKLGEIDLVLSSKKDKKVIVGECKLNASEINMNQVVKMRDNFSRMNLVGYEAEFILFCAQVVDKNKKNELKKEGIIVIDNKELIK